VNEEQATNEGSDLAPGQASPLQPSMNEEPARGAGPEGAGTAAPATTGGAIAAARSGRHPSNITTTRSLGVAGVAAIVVVASILGSVLLRGAGNTRVVLAASNGAAATSGAQITVTGNGQVEGRPDTATFSIGVDTTASTAVAALEQNNAQVVALESSLRQSGVVAKDMQTSSLDLWTNTDSNGNVTGFSASDQLNVTMHKLSKLGTALDAAVQATGNGVTLGGISFSISNQSALLAAARAQAMLAARTQADQLAAGAGLTLGSIIKVTDQENSYQSSVIFGADLPTAAAGKVPVQAGQQQISVQVTVVYQLKST